MCKFFILSLDLTEGAKSMTLSEDSEKNEKQRMDLFYSFLKQRSDAGDVEGAKAISEILHEADRYCYYSIINHLFMFDQF